MTRSKVNNPLMLQVMLILCLSFGGRDIIADTPGLHVKCVSRLSLTAPIRCL